MDEEWIRPARALLCLAVFILLAIFNLGIAARNLPPTGDEPHYLITAHSLAIDHDLSLQNNYLKKDYRAFYSGELAKRTTPSADAKRELPAEGLGLSFLLAPAYSLARSAFPQAWLIPFLRLLLCSITAIVLYQILSLHTGAPVAVCAAFFLVSPLLFYSGQFYPEMPAALLVALCLACLVELEEHPMDGLVLLGLSAGGLVWLHPKYLVLAAAIHIVSAIRFYRVFRVYREFKTVFRITLLLMLGLAGIFSFLFFLHREYGSWSPNRIYAGWEPDQQKSLLELIQQEGFARIGVMFRMLFGFWIDQRFGILMFAPVYVAFFAGLFRLLQRRAPLAGSMTFIFACHFGSLCWGAPLGGYAPPSRHMIVLIPIMLYVILCVYREWSRKQRVVFYGLLGLSLVISVFMALNYRSLFTNLTWRNPDQASPFWQLCRLDSVLPNLTSASPSIPLILLWTFFFAGLAWFLKPSDAEEPAS